MAKFYAQEINEAGEPVHTANHGYGQEYDVADHASAGAALDAEFPFQSEGSHAVVVQAASFRVVTKENNPIYSSESISDLDELNPI